MNKQAIVLVFLFFLAPVIIAVLLHSQWFSWQPGGTRNHGELIQPVIPLPDFDPVVTGGERVGRDELLDRWQLVHLRHSHCDEVCLEALYWLRQIRLAQDRHQPDVGLLLISSQPIGGDTRERILSLASDFLIFDGEGAAELLPLFPDHDGDQASYILDPMANIILRYPPDADPNGIRRDLRRLLTWTQRN